MVYDYDQIFKFDPLLSNGKTVYKNIFYRVPIRVPTGLGTFKSINAEN
jgi:hypothetical protein